MGDVVGICVCYHRVFSHDIERLEFAFSCSFHHCCDRESDFSLFRYLASPESFDLFRSGGKANLKVARQCRGEASHVACALDVVLSAERVDSCSRTAQHSAEKRQVAAAADVVGTGRMLCDAHRVVKR